jgi:hypothetical protein
MYETILISLSKLISLFLIFIIFLFTLLFDIVAEILPGLLLDIQLVLVGIWFCGCSFWDFMGLKQVADSRFRYFWKLCFRVFFGFQDGKIYFLVLNGLVYVDFETDYLLFFQYLVLFPKLLVFPVFHFNCFFFGSFFFYEFFFLYGFEFGLECPF